MTANHRFDHRWRCRGTIQIHRDTPPPPPPPPPFAVRFRNCRGVERVRANEAKRTGGRSPSILLKILKNSPSFPGLSMSQKIPGHFRVSQSSGHPKSAPKKTRTIPSSGKVMASVLVCALDNFYSLFSKSKTNQWRVLCELITAFE